MGKKPPDFINRLCRHDWLQPPWLAFRNAGAGSAQQRKAQEIVVLDAEASRMARSGHAEEARGMRTSADAVLNADISPHATMTRAAAAACLQPLRLPLIGALRGRRRAPPPNDSSVWWQGEQRRHRFDQYLRLIDLDIAWLGDKQSIHLHWGGRHYAPVLTPAWVAVGAGAAAIERSRWMLEGAEFEARHLHSRASSRARSALATASKVHRVDTAWLRVDARRLRARVAGAPAHGQRADAGLCAYPEEAPPPPPRDQIAHSRQSTAAASAASSPLDPDSIGAVRL